LLQFLAGVWVNAHLAAELNGTGRAYGERVGYVAPCGLSRPSRDGADAGPEHFAQTDNLGFVCVSLSPKFEIIAY
jgi:hypothetical protein